MATGRVPEEQLGSEPRQEPESEPEELESGRWSGLAAAQVQSEVMEQRPAAEESPLAQRLLAVEAMRPLKLWVEHGKRLQQRAVEMKVEHHWKAPQQG
jgi:hypothetical protein